MNENNRMLISMTADLAASYVAGNMIASSALPRLISELHVALTTLNGPPKAVVPEPAVPVRRSIRNDRIICLECGKDHKMLKRHLMTSHDLTVDGYRVRWSLPDDYPVVSPDYAALRSKMARKFGLGRKPGKK